jgi:hypothetical protein
MAFAAARALILVSLFVCHNSFLTRAAVGAHGSWIKLAQLSVAAILCVELDSIRNHFDTKLSSAPRRVR